MSTILDTIQLLDRSLVNASTISTNQLRQLTDHRGATLASIITRTVPALRKRGNQYYGDCFKLAKTNVVINPSDRGYEDSVNRQLIREEKSPAFEAEPRLWGAKLPNKPFIAHVNKSGEAKSYLWVKVEKVLWQRYMNSQGIFLDADEVERYLVSSSPSKRQGTEKEIVVRNYTMENVVGLFMNGEKFLIEH